MSADGSALDSFFDRLHDCRLEAGSLDADAAPSTRNARNRSQGRRSLRLKQRSVTPGEATVTEIASATWNLLQMLF
jgi:hypothetical protein